MREPVLRDTARHESEWISAHAFYQDELDLLVTGVVDPLARLLVERDLAREFFFLRYWDGGSHMRLRVLPTRQADRSEIEAIVTGHFGTFLARNPSPDRVGQAEYARMARSLAERESVTEYSAILCPNNSVAFVPYRREHERYGTGRSVQAVERHFADSSRIALAVLNRGATMDQRASAATAMILLTWLSYDPDPASLAQWISKDGKRITDIDRTAGEKFDGLVLAQRDRAVTLVRQMHALTANPPPASARGTLVDWLRTINTLRDRLIAHVAAGVFVPPTRGWEGPDGIATHDPRARVLTVLDVCAHLMCNRLGLSPVAEGGIRRLAVAALAELAEQGW